MLRALLLLFNLMPLLAMGAIYKYINPNGTVEYSDQSREGAVEVKVAPLRTDVPLPSKIKKTLSPEEAQPQQAVSSYQLSIVNPKNEATVRENTGKIEVTLQVTPPIDANSNYTLQLLLDGQAMDEVSTRPKYTLTNVDRGTHTLQAKLLDPWGRVVAHSKSITFYMRRHSILFRNKGGNHRAPQMPKMPGPPSPGSVAFP